MHMYIHKKAVLPQQQMLLAKCLPVFSVLSDEKVTQYIVVSIILIYLVFHYV